MKSRFLVLLLASIAVSLAQVSVARANPTCDALFKQQKSLDARIETMRTESLKLEDGRYMHLEVMEPANSDFATFLLMPGMNFGELMTEPTVQMLVSKGYGVAIMSFSVQPFSIANSNAKETPFFKRRKVKIEDLVQETDVAAQFVRKTFATDNIVPVSMSFSGTVSPLLRGYPLIIENVPMTSEPAVNAKSAEFKSMMAPAEMFNPFMSAFFTRPLLEKAYREQWTKTADRLIKTFSLPENRKSDYVDGYMSISQVGEGRKWDVNQLDPNARRVFVLAVGDQVPLLKDQLETVAKIIGNGKTSLILIEGSGHIISKDQPAIYANVLMHSASVVGVPGSVTIMQPPKEDKPGQVLTVSPEKSLAWINAYVKELSKASK